MDATEQERVQIAYDAIKGQFGLLTAAEMTDERRAQMRALFQTVADQYRRYMVSYFFSCFWDKLEEWSTTGVFADRQVLRLLAELVASFYIENARDEYGRKEWRGSLNTSVGRMMEALGFYENALRHYESAYYDARGAIIFGGSYGAEKTLREFLARYRSSGQNIPALAAEVERHVSSIVKRKDIPDPGYWVGVVWHIDDPRKRARRDLSELGFTEDKIRDLLRS